MRPQKNNAQSELEVKEGVEISKITIVEEVVQINQVGMAASYGSLIMDMYAKVCGIHHFPESKR